MSPELSALVRVPWDSPALLGWVCALLGCAGVVYALVTAWRMRRQTAYKPDGEDWLFHALLPLMAYALLAISAFAGFAHPREALFGIGAATLLLLFDGIHNAWDAAFYSVLMMRNQNPPEQPPQG